MGLIVVFSTADERRWTQLKSYSQMRLISVLGLLKFTSKHTQRPCLYLWILSAFIGVHRRFMN
jgi:hypothetical protein